MSSIVLSSAVRQNLLALQDTAAALATTQNDLSTGKKVNSALDNPTNFFTAAGLDNRAGDISNLLDGISNGVQVLQAANTGITSIESLVSQAKSIANQALQTSIGYSAKASVTSAAITNANGNPVTADDLRGATTITPSSVTASTPATSSTATALADGTTELSAIGVNTTDSFTLSVNGGPTKTFNFNGTSGQAVTVSGDTTTIDLSVATLNDLTGALTAADGASTWSVSGASIVSTGTETDVLTNGTGAAAGSLLHLGYSGGTLAAGSNPAFANVSTVSTFNQSTLLSSLNLTSAISTSDTLTVNGKTISFVNTGSGSTITSSGATLDLASATGDDLAKAIDAIAGSTASFSDGEVTFTASTSSLDLTGTALAKIGLTAGTTAPVGQTLSFAAVGNGTATTVTFGDGTNGTVKTLDQLNTQLAADNLQATLDSTTGKLTITTTNDAASAAIAAPTGTAVSSSSGAFYNQTVTAPVADATSQSARATLVAQYNAILTQIDNTASDSSYNGVNLLNGDQLQLTFNETGKSKLNITGVNFSSAGLGLSSLVSGTDFIDNNATNAVLSTLNTVSSTLRSEASALGSNLSVVQTRQDFNTNLINVLQTGSANLTQADINLEAANSQALTTRQSLSVSALSLANQSQQSVLQLLR
jgi:hypothetical protein